MPFALNRYNTPEQLLVDTQIIRYATWTRYLSLAGLVVLLYDHTLTFGMEVQFMWKSTPNQSATKILFLCNRYLVPVVLLVLAHSMCGFLPVEHHYDDTGYYPGFSASLSPGLCSVRCAILLTISSSLAIISMGVENFLILIRVTVLWDHNKTVARLMLILYTLSYGCTVTTLVITILQISDGIVYSGVGRLCVTTKTSPELVAIWIAPFLFDIAVLIFTVSNALARPRRADMRLAKVLRYDGIAFFVTILSLRCLNIAFAATSDPSIVLLPAFTVWPMIAVIINRLLLDLDRVEDTGIMALSSQQYELGGKHIRENGHL